MVEPNSMGFRSGVQISSKRMVSRARPRWIGGASSMLPFMMKRPSSNVLPQMNGSVRGLASVVPRAAAAIFPART